MEKKYDVAVYGLWYGNNYGSMITYYALSKVLESMHLTYAMIKNPLGANVDVHAAAGLADNDLRRECDVVALLVAEVADDPLATSSS